MQWSELDAILADLKLECSHTLYVIVGSCLGVFLCLIIATSVCIHRHKWEIKLWFVDSVIDKKAKQKEQKENEFLFDAFVAFHQSDIRWVKYELLPNTEGHRLDKFNLCLHHRDFKAGCVIEENIVSSIKESRRTILVISKNFLISNWCYFELQMARSESFDVGRDIIIPILIEPESDIRGNANMPGTLLNLLRSRTYLEWPSDTDDLNAKELFWRSVRNAVKSTATRPLRCDCGCKIYPYVDACRSRSRKESQCSNDVECSSTTPECSNATECFPQRLADHACDNPGASFTSLEMQQDNNEDIRSPTNAVPTTTRQSISHSHQMPNITLENKLEPHIRSCTHVQCMPQHNKDLAKYFDTAL